MKRNAADSSRPLLHGQEDSKIRGVKNIGIISTPIVWPVKQRPLHTSKPVSTDDQSPDRKNAPNYFLLTTPEIISSVPVETQVNILVGSTAFVYMDHNSSINYSSFSNTTGHSGNLQSERDNPREMPTILLGYIRNMVLPLQHSASIHTGPLQTWAHQTEHTKSYPVFPSPVSQDNLYESTKEQQWMLSPDSDVFSFLYKSTYSILQSLNAWNEITFYNHLVSGIPEEKHHFLSIQSSSSALPVETSLDLLERSFENVYLEPTNRLLEEGSARNGFFIMGDLQSTKSENNIREHNSVQFKKQVLKQNGNPSGSLQNINAWLPDVTPLIHPTETLLPAEYSTKLQNLSAVLLETRERRSEMYHTISVSHLYQEMLNVATSKDGLVMLTPLMEQLEHSYEEASSPEDEIEFVNTFISYINHMPPSLTASENTILKPNTLPGVKHLKDNIANDSNDVFLTTDSKNMVRTSKSWKASNLSLPINYVDNTTSMRNWILTQKPVMPFEGSSERRWLLHSQPFSFLGDRVPSSTFPQQTDDLSIQTTANKSRDIKKITFTPMLERERMKLNSIGPELSSKISERTEKTPALETKTDLFLNSSVPINNASPLHFPLSSLEIPLMIQPSLHLQTDISEMSHVAFTDRLENIAGLTMQQRLDETAMGYVMNPFPSHNEVLASYFKPSCTQSNHDCIKDESAWSSGIDVIPLQSQNMYTAIQSNQFTRASNDIKNKEFPFVNNAFPGKQILLISNLLTSTQPLVLAMSRTLESQISQLVNFSASQISSTSSVLYILPSDLSQNSPNSDSLWKKELNMQTNSLSESYLTENAKQSAEDPKSKLISSVQLDDVDGDVDHVSSNSNRSSVLAKESFQKVNTSSAQLANNAVLSHLNPSNVQATDFYIWRVSTSFEDYLDYEKIENHSSLLETTMVSVVTNTIDLLASYVEHINNVNENTLNNTDVITGPTSHHLILHSQSTASVSEPEIPTNEKLLTSVLNGTSQNTAPYTPLHSSTNSTKSVLSCFLCNSFIDWGCSCGPEVNHSMSKCEARCLKKSFHLLYCVEWI